MRMGSCLALGVGIDSTYMAMGVYMLLLTALPFGFVGGIIGCICAAVQASGPMKVISDAVAWDIRANTESGNNESATSAPTPAPTPAPISTVCNDGPIGCFVAGDGWWTVLIGICVVVPTITVFCLYRINLDPPDDGSVTELS